MCVYICSAEYVGLPIKIFQSLYLSRMNIVVSADAGLSGSRRILVKSCGTDVTCHRNFRSRRWAAMAISYLLDFPRRCDLYGSHRLLWGLPCGIFAWNVILCVKSTHCPRNGTPVFGSSCAVPPQKSVPGKSQSLGYFLFGSVARLPGNSLLRMDTNSLEWN